MRKTDLILVVFIGLVLLQGSLSAQPFRSVKQTEDSLKQLFHMATGSIATDTRSSAGQQFATLFYRTLEMQDSFAYPFDSLPTVSKLTSPDNTFRIYTWNIPLLSGVNTFYGAIQMKWNKNDSINLIVLHDKSAEIAHPERSILTPQRWYGALYYQIIPERTFSGEMAYTLLGWHGENMLLTARVIDILSISPGGKIQFGRTMFCGVQESKPSRIIFRYSARASMVLRYEKQYIVTSKKWNAKRREYKFQHEREFIIVFDRLVPANPQLEGQFEHYIPAGDIMDGFIFKEGCWNFIENVDTRNPK